MVYVEEELLGVRRAARWSPLSQARIRELLHSLQLNLFLCFSLAISRRTDAYEINQFERPTARLMLNVLSKRNVLCPNCHNKLSCHS